MLGNRMIRLLLLHWILLVVLVIPSASRAELEVIMPVQESLFIPSNPQTLALRPLNKGMITSTSSLSSDKGSLRKVGGFDATERGLQRLGGWRPVVSNVSGSNIPLTLLFGAAQTETARQLGEVIEDVFFQYLSSGAIRSVVVTNRALYVLDPSSGFTPVYWARLYVVSSYNGAGANGIITIAGTLGTTDMLRANDWVTLMDGATRKYFKISTVAVTTETTLTLVGKPTNNPAPSSTFNILKLFQVAGEDFVDYTSARYETYLVDGTSTMIFKYDGNFLTGFTLTDPDNGALITLYGAKTITHFKERLYFGNLISNDSGTLLDSQRVRWTEVLDWTESASGNYQDLSNSQGRIRKLLGHGELLMAYTEDRIYYGRQTNMSSLPYAFFQVETGGVTALGMKAVSTFMDGQIFVGQDDIYYVGSEPSLERIGTPVANETVIDLKHPSQTRVKLDVQNNHVVFGFSRNNPSLDVLFRFNYKSKAWSYADDVQFQILTTAILTDAMVVSDLGVSESYATSPYGPMQIGSFSISATLPELCIFDSYGYLYKYSADNLANRMIIGGATTDVPIQTVLETQDYDLDDPDTDKTVLHLGIKLDEKYPRTENIRVRVRGSTNRGRTWKHLGTLVFRPGDDEDQLNFRLTGSTIRFELTSGVVAHNTHQMVQPFEVVEMTLLLRARGSEAQRNTSRS